MIDFYTIIIYLLAALGAISLIFVFGSTIYSWLQLSTAILSKHFLPNEKHTLLGKYGNWAVVTGATDGIGKQYALQLASREINVILISRNLERLENTAKEIEQKYSVKTKVIVADFSKGPEVYKHIEKELQGIPIGILINNVGMQTSFPTFITESSEKELWDIIMVNCGAATFMTKIILPQMKQRQQGAIVNISSGSQYQPLPLMSVYAATKTYLKHFTEAIRFEYSKYNITIQLMIPFFLNTKMNAFSTRLQENSLFVPDAEMYVKHAIETLGKVDSSNGYWPHSLQCFFINLAPMWLRSFIGGYVNIAFRNEYLMSNKIANTHL